MIKVIEDKMVLNREKNGIELYFDTKPDNDTITTLKTNKWRWFPPKGCWYNKNTPENLDFAKTALSGNFDIVISNNETLNVADIVSTKDSTQKQRTPKPKTVENEFGYKVGDILVAEWGYSMSLVDAYQVVRVTAKSIYTKEIATKTIDDLGGYSGECIPVPDKFISDEMYCSRTLNANNYVSIDGHLASKWDGKKTYYYNTMD